MTTTSLTIRSGQDFQLLDVGEWPKIVVDMIVLNCRFTLRNNLQLATTAIYSNNSKQTIDRSIANDAAGCYQQGHVAEMSAFHCCKMAMLRWTTPGRVKSLGRRRARRWRRRQTRTGTAKTIASATVKAIATAIQARALLPTTATAATITAINNNDRFSSQVCRHHQQHNHQRRKQKQQQHHNSNSPRQLKMKQQLQQIERWGMPP